MVHNVSESPRINLNFAMLHIVQNFRQIHQEIIVFRLLVGFKNVLCNFVFHLAILSQKALVYEVKEAVFSKVYFSRRKGT